MHYQRGNNNKWLFLFFLFFSLALVCAWRGGRRGGGRGRDRRSPPPSMLAAGGKFMGNIRFSAELTKKKFFLNYRPMMSANFKFPFHLLVLLLGLRLPPSLPTSTSAFTPTRLYYNIIHQLIQSFTPPYTLGQFHSYLFLVVSAQHQESSNPVGPS